VRDDAGKFWFENPEGERFLSMGITHIGAQDHMPPEGTQYYDPIRNQFGGDAQAWIGSVLGIMRRGHFNTIGAWSDPLTNGCGLYETPILYVAGFDQDRALEGLRPGYEQRVRENLRKHFEEYPDRGKVIGYYLDNEVAWFGKWAWVEEPTYTLLEMALALEPEDPARVAAVDLLKRRYGTPAEMAQAWGIELEDWGDLTERLLESSYTQAAQKDRYDFATLASEAYFEPAARVVREAVPGALILGVRFAGRAPEPVARVCGKYCDVISLNAYTNKTLLDHSQLDRMWVWGRKPVLITEFSWRARENSSGDPNTRGAGGVVQTQADRANNYRAYVTDLIAQPWVLGAHWFEFSDQSPQGRFDGEDSNYGVVDIHHNVYDELLDAMAEVNTRAEAIHRESDAAFPSELPEAPAVTLLTGQYPDRPPTLDLLADPIAPPSPYNATDASVTVSIENGTLTAKYDTGESWGCGFHVFGPKKLKLPEATRSEATDLAGYTRLVLEATVPDGLTFSIILDEAGVGPPGGDFSSPSADDGESFSTPGQHGHGRLHTYTIDLHRLFLRNTWGNQEGLKRIDMNAMLGIAVGIEGKQGAGELVIHKMWLEK